MGISAQPVMKVKDVCREHEISNATYYYWKSKNVAWKPPTFGARANWLLPYKQRMD